MKKSELLKILAQYADDQEILIEAGDGGFDDPVVYITAVRGRKGHEFAGPASSEYMNEMSGVSFGAVVLGTAPGLERLG